MAAAASAAPGGPAAQPAGTSKRWRNTIGGALAGAAEALCLHPTDTVKTRLQLQQIGPDGRAKYRGTIHCASTIAREEGALALYKGLTPFTMHLMVKYSLRFFTFNTFQSALGGGGGGGGGGSKTLPATPLTNFVAGMLAGVTEAILIVTPFEVVKIRLQAQLGLDKAQLKYRGPLHCAYTVARKEGITALWKGVGPTIVRNASNQACNFMSYDWIKRNLWFRDGRTELQPWQTIVTGAAAGAIGPLLNGPMDVVKTRLMRQERVPGQLPKYRNMIHAISVIAREEGVAALYKGLGPRLLRLAPGQAITWTVVEQVNRLFNKFDGVVMG